MVLPRGQSAVQFDVFHAGSIISVSCCEIASGRNCGPVVYYLQSYSLKF